MFELPSEKSFALVEKDGVVTLYSGELHDLETLEELKQLTEDAGKQAVFALPFRTIRERGFEAQGDEPILALLADDVQSAPMEAVRDNLPDDAFLLEEDIRAVIGDAGYVQMVRRLQNDEIEGGNISQATLGRRFEGKIHEFDLDKALSLYRTILISQGQYMTVLLADRRGHPQRPNCIIGATPERHLTVTEDETLMIPIAGTLRKEDETSFDARLEKFLNDPKEINELFQVVDEELKMMGRICPDGGVIDGPHLREIGAVVHTEYHLRGHRGLEPIEALRLTLHAPTVVGGPMESAARIIAKHEPESRRYYGGEFGVYIPASLRGKALLDCAILLRCAEIFADGTIGIKAGGGIVRDSKPVEEARESRAKAMGIMTFLLNEPRAAARFMTPERLSRINALLHSRNRDLSSFWMQDQAVQSGPSATVKCTITIVNNEDDFVYMQAHMLSALGHRVQVVDTFDFDPAANTDDIIILGPGPGDINDNVHPRMVKLRQITADLIAAGRPLFCICLGHQALSHHLGLDVLRQKSSTQGMQKEVDVFGTKHKLGFYNSFSPVVKNGANVPEGVTLSIDEDGRIIALKGKNFIGYQFHPESIMSRTGLEVMDDAVRYLMGKS